ncbi:hypothetical protein [Rubritalea tangerina]|uniref:hypothetical protein n=1 Tax=Rubritalea tangerina TaxID=430798 RepID=UPI00361A8FEA
MSRKQVHGSLNKALDSYEGGSIVKPIIKRGMAALFCVWHIVYLKCLCHFCQKLIRLVGAHAFPVLLRIIYHS